MTSKPPNAPGHHGAGGPGPSVELLRVPARLGVHEQVGVERLRTDRGQILDAHRETPSSWFPRRLRMRRQRDGGRAAFSRYHAPSRRRSGPGQWR